MGKCESCGAEIHGKVENATCRGCGKVVCQSCCDVFDHLENGLHGVGNPQEAVATLRAALEFYAVKRNWGIQSPVRRVTDSWAELDRGDRARAALAPAEGDDDT